MALSYGVNSVLLLCLVSSLTVPTFATANDPPPLTSGAGVPNPLSPPHPLITQPARIGRALLGRGIATCGYISGNGAYPLTCPAGYTCGSIGQFITTGWACCNQIQCVGNYYTCADYGAGLCTGGLDANECSSIFTSILSCSDSAAPSCFLYARSTHLGDLWTASSYGCGASGGTVLVLATTTTTGEVVTALSASMTNYFPTLTTTGNTFFTSGGSSLNTGSIIGITIAATGTLGTLVGAYYAWKAVQRRRAGDPAGRSRALGNDGGDICLTVRPAYGPAPGVYGALQPEVYGPPPSHAAGPMYSTG